MTLILNGEYTKNDYRKRLIHELTCDYIDLNDIETYNKKDLDLNNNILNLYVITPYTDILEIVNYINNVYNTDNSVLCILYNDYKNTFSDSNKRIIKEYESELINNNKIIFNDLDSLIEYLNRL